MDSALPLLAALYAGLAGSMHCVSMCGGIAALGGMGSSKPVAHVTLFNAGRIASYAAAGALGAWLVSLGVGFVPSPTARMIVALMTGAVLIILGLYFAAGLRLLSALEGLGGRFWQRLSPLLGRFLPIRHPTEALAVGALWGWLPCGLVYMTLPLAWSTGRPETGALVMAVFGLGTAPAMIGVGLGGGGLRVALRRPAVRRWAGGTMVLFGALMAASPWLFPHGSGHADQDMHHQHAAIPSFLGEPEHVAGTALRYVCGSSDRLRNQLHAVHGHLDGLAVSEQVEGAGRGTSAIEVR